MKNKILNSKTGSIWVWTVICCSILMFTACEGSSTNEEDSIPPSEVSNITFKANHGGGTFYYKVPEDEDILSVKAVYTLDSGREIFKSASFYTDSLQIEGLGSIKEYSVKLIAVDRSGNESKPKVQNITPLLPFGKEVLETVDVIPAFAGVIVSWKNRFRKGLVLGVSYTVENHEFVKKYASNSLTDNLFIDNLESIPYDFNVFIEDNYENITENASFSEIIPLEDIKIEKAQFSFLRDDLLPDEMNESWVEIDESTGLEITQTRTLTRMEKGGYQGVDGDEPHWNAMERGLDGKVQFFWDDIIDDGLLLNKNFFATGLSTILPFSYYIDMGRTIRMSRFRVWQRDWDWAKQGRDQSGYYYTTENIQTFELWISDDKINWEKVRKARIVKPIDEAEARKEGVEGHHFIVYEEEPKFTKPFRYLEYRALKQFSTNGGKSCNASEITIYGEEAN